MSAVISEPPSACLRVVRDQCYICEALEAKGFFSQLKTLQLGPRGYIQMEYGDKASDQPQCPIIGCIAANSPADGNLAIFNHRWNPLLGRFDTNRNFNDLNIRNIQTFCYAFLERQRNKDSSHQSPSYSPLLGHPSVHSPSHSPPLHHPSVHSPSLHHPSVYSPSHSSTYIPQNSRIDRHDSSRRQITPNACIWEISKQICALGLSTKVNCVLSLFPRISRSKRRPQILFKLSSILSSKLDTSSFCFSITEEPGLTRLIPLECKEVVSYICQPVKYAAAPNQFAYSCLETMKRKDASATIESFCRMRLGNMIQQGKNKYNHAFTDFVDLSINPTPLDYLEIFEASEWVEDNSVPATYELVFRMIDIDLESNMKGIGELLNALSVLH